MAFTSQKVLEGYAELSERVLGEASVIRNIAHKDIQGDISKGETLKVFVQGLATINNYVPGTGVAQTDNNSNFVTLTNQKDKAINEIMDGLAVEQAYSDMNYVAGRLEAAMVAMGEQIDTDAYAKMVVDGTEDFAAGIAKPTTGDEVYDRMRKFMEELGNEKAPNRGRYIVMSPEMHSLLLDGGTKVRLQEPQSKFETVEGVVGRLLGFDIFVSVNLPAGTNMIALQERGFAHTDDYIVAPKLVSLDFTNDKIGDSAIKGRFAYNSGAIRPTLIRIDNSQA